MEGYACSSSGSSSCGVEGVVVFSEEEGDVATSSCNNCGTKRTIQRRRALEAESDEIDSLLRARPPPPRPETWRLYERQQAILVEELALHPRNARLAKFYREVGTFLLDCSLPISVRPEPPTALEMFTRELAATEWVLPATKLPARGLLHFQLGKLVFGGEHASEDDGSRTLSRRDVEKAAMHFQTALSMYAQATLTLWCCSKHSTDSVRLCVYAL